MFFTIFHPPPAARLFGLSSFRAQLSDEATLFLGQDYDIAADKWTGQKYGVGRLHVYTKKGLTSALQPWNSLKHPKEWERVYKFGV